MDTLTCDRTQFMLNVWYMDFLKFPSEASYNAQGLQEGEREPGPSKQFLKSFIPTLFHAVNWASDRTTAGNFYAFVKQLIVVDAASHTWELESYGGGLNEQHTGGELFIEIEQRMEDDWDANPSNYQIHALFDDVWQLIVTGKLDDPTEYDEDDLVEIVMIPDPELEIIPDVPLNKQNNFKFSIRRNKLLQTNCERILQWQIIWIDSLNIRSSDKSHDCEQFKCLVYFNFFVV